MRRARGMAMVAAALAALASWAVAARATAGVSPPDAPPTVASQCVEPAGFAPPFTHIYHLRGGGMLVFVAIRHSRDPADDSHRQIAAAMDRYHPSLVLIEGIDSGSPEAIAFQRAAAERQSAAGSVQETLYAVKLASDRGIAFASWDLRPYEAMRHGVAAGFALADIVGAHLLRANVEPSAAADFAPAMQRELRYAAKVGAIGAFDYPAWYARNYPAAPAAADRSPCGTGIASRVLKAESDARSLHLAELIAARATSGQVVMVEAGANHWLALQADLRRRSTAVD